MNKKNNNLQEKQILYSVLQNSKIEITDGLDNELEEYIKIYVSDIPDNLSIKKYIKLGVSALSLLDNNNFKFEENTQKQIEILRIYIEKCIENKAFCKSNLFLAYVKDFLNKQLPSPTIYTNFVYSQKQLEEKIHLQDNNKKLNALLFNEKKIDLKKDYVCNGLIDLLICSLYEIFNNKFYIKKCENCNRYFITPVNKENVIYCEYLFNNTSLTCKQLMNRKNYLIKRKENVLSMKYATLIAKYNNKYVRESEKIEIKNIDEEEVNKYKNIREAFKKEYKRITSLVKSEKITISDALKMLEKFDKEVYYGSKGTNKK